MWVFLNNAFLSVVQHRHDPARLLVRSRVKGDIQQVVPGAEVFEDPNADYRYRAFVPREQFARAMADAVASIDYPNFKDSVRDPKRLDVAHDVWQVLADAYGAYGDPPAGE